MNILQQLAIGLSSIVCGTNLPAIADFALASQISLATPPAPDKVVESGTVVGYFTNFVWGDYFYAVIKTDRRNIHFLIDRNEDCFLALHQRSRFTIQYDIIRRYIPQAGSYQPIKVIRNIQTNRTSLAKWSRSIPLTKLKQCRQLVDRATESS
jgi:hypothetical protein